MASARARLTDVGSFRAFASSTTARPLRFLAVGGVTFGVNVAFLMLFTSAGLNSVVAYAIALALSVQFNFIVNQLLVWHDRPIGTAATGIAARWLTFHACIAASLAVNLVAFAVAERFVADIAAALIAVAASTAIKFASLDRLAFRSRPAR